MARSRNIKPGLFKNELLGEADPLLTILFIGLWCLADREGKLEDRPKRIKAEIFPYRELPDFNGYLTVLQQLGFIDRYLVDEKEIIKVSTFNKHQSPHKTEKPSDLPCNPLKTQVTGTAPLDNETLTDEAALIPDSLLLIPDSRDKDARGKTSAKSAPVPYSKIIDAYHDLLPMCPKVKVITDTRKRHISTRWKNGCEGLKFWEAYFAHVKKSRFLTGRAEPSRPDRKPFVADIDFLIRESTVVKTQEGKYHG